MFREDIDGEPGVEMKCPRIAFRRSILTNTSGGSSETDENEFTRHAMGCP